MTCNVLPLKSITHTKEMASSIFAIKYGSAVPPTFVFGRSLAPINCGLLVLSAKHCELRVLIVPVFEGRRKDCLQAESSVSASRESWFRLRKPQQYEIC